MARDPERLASTRAALARLRAGGLVAFPTETVWGIAADARSEPALARLRRFKGREAERPVALLVAEPAALARLGVALPEPGRRLAAAFWPGPLTLVVGARLAFASGVARRDGAVGWRCSPHPTAETLARAAEAEGLGPLTATSLNRSGEPPATTRAAAAALCSGRPDAPALLDLPGPDAGGGEPSSVVEVDGGVRILREGALPAEAIRAALAEKRCA